MLRVATDFSGLGSPEEALKRLSVEHRVVFACDKDKYAKLSYLANHQPEAFFNDITTRDNKEAPDSDLYVFGFPCQAFSLSGKRLGFEDTRGTLFFNSLEYISIHRPRVFIAENVKGLLSHDKTKGSKSQYGKTFGVFRDALALTVNGQHNLYKYDDCVNYHIHFKVLNTKDFGIPQNRERIFIVGFRDEADAVNFRMPKGFVLKKRLKDILEPDVDKRYFLSDKMLSHLIKNKRNRITSPTSPTILANQSKQSTDNVFIGEPVIVAMRGRNKENPSSRKIGEQLEQRLEINSQGITNCLTSVQKDNLVLIGNLDFKHEASNRVYSDEGISVTIQAHSGGGGGRTGLYLIKEATKKGFDEAYDGDSINLSNPSSKTRRGRVGKKVANTLDTQCNQGVVVEEKIRRLTPMETFRLQGFSDIFFKKCQAVNSETQLYIRAGNSITVDTIMYLLIQVLSAIKIKYEYEK